MQSWRIRVFTFHMITLSGEKPKEKASFYYHSGFALNQVKKQNKTKKTRLLDVHTEAAAGFVSARYQNCTINNPVSVYTEDKIRKRKIYIQYRCLPDYCAFQDQSLGGTVLSCVAQLQALFFCFPLLWPCCS